MGNDKQTEQTATTAVTPQQTAEEKELNQLALERQRAFQSGRIEAGQAGLGLVSRLLAGQGLPGYLGALPGGITPEMTQEIAREAVGDIPPALQAQGLLDSGIGQSIMARTAGDVRRASAQFNLQNLSNLLTTALTGQQAVVQPMMAGDTYLGSRLAGLRPTTTTYNYGYGGTTGGNPFLQTGLTGAGALIGGLASAPVGGMGAGTGATIGGILGSSAGKLF
jgi:hypothetical protein